MSQNVITRNESPTAALRKVKWGVMVGTALEWFDFYLYASMAAVILGKVFFPEADSATSTLASLATFAVGFIVRPLGGVVLGYVGDRVGRKYVLTLTLVLMGLSTGLIGLIPSYAAIGVMAPVLLVLLRLLQGVAAGAEASTAMVMAYEHADDASRARLMAWPALGSSVGLLAASLTVTALTSFSQDVVLSWGWRVPFIASFVLAAIGLWVRRQVPETPEFERLSGQQNAGEKPRITRDLIRSNLLGLISVLAVTGGYLGASYTFKTFSLSYLTTFRGVPENVGTFGIVLASAVALVTIPLAGRLTDRFGFKKVMVIGSAAMALMAFPFFRLLDTGRPALIWTGLIICSGIIIPMMLVATSTFMAAQFPPHVRSSGVGAAREIAAAFSGGLVPLAALSMVTMSKNHTSWGVSLLFIAAAALVVLGAVLDQSRRASKQQELVGEHGTVAAEAPGRA
ncbi:MFS transporter [Streptomyces sp. NPDC048629]|uniref:MFS transporter n=1 Tax=Streptomyces sp. NPDC048629 TaxID=3154824 RepID=UPI003414A8DA